MKNGKVSEDSRITQTLPTIKYLLKQKASIVMCSHLGRPEGKVVDSMRMKAAAMGIPFLPVRSMLGTGGEVEHQAWPGA